MEEAVAQRVAQERLDERVGQLFKIVAGGAQARHVRHLDAVDPFHGDDIAARTLPIDCRNAEAGIVLGVLANLGEGRSLKPKVHFDARCLFKRPRHFDGAQPLGFWQETLLHLGDEIHGLQIGRKTLPHAGADNLYRDLALDAVDHDLGRMNLCHGRRRDRIIKMREEIVRLAAQRAFDLRDRLRHREGRHAVLQEREIGGKFLSDHVGTGRQKLSHLHIGRTQPLHGAGEIVGAGAAAGAIARKKLQKRLSRANRRGQAFRRKCADNAFANQNPADAGKPGIRCQSGHEIRASSRNEGRQCRPCSW